MTPAEHIVALTLASRAGRASFLDRSSRVTTAFRQRLALVSILLATGSRFAAAQDDIRELKLRDWEPRSMLVTRATVVETPRFPVIDIHNHLGGGKEFLRPDRVERYLTEMNESGVRTVVNLDG